MATTGTFFEALISYYGNLSTEALNAMRLTREELRAGDVSVSKMLGRMTSLCMDAAEGWWSALLVNASAPLPTVFMYVEPDDTTHVQTARVILAQGQEPQMSELAQVGGMAHIPSDAIRLETTRLGDAVELTLKGLKPLRAKISSGLYGGIIHLGQKPLAFVMVRVA